MAFTKVRHDHNGLTGPVNLTLINRSRKQRYIIYMNSNVRRRTFAHSHWLIRNFTVRILDSQGFKVPSADAQPDLSLLWAHMSEALRKHAFSNISKFSRPKPEKFQIKNSDIFSYFCSKHRLL